MFLQAFLAVMNQKSFESVLPTDSLYEGGVVMRMLNYVCLLFFILSASQKIEANQDQPLLLNLQSPGAAKQNSINTLNKRYNSTALISISDLWNWSDGDMSFVTREISSPVKQMPFAYIFPFGGEQAVEQSIRVDNDRSNDNSPAHDEESKQELRCLALSIYFEARGESEAGQHAVGHVVMNRVSNSRFPDSVCNVVHQGGEKPYYRCQFSWWCDGRSDKPVNKTSWNISVKIAREIYSGKSIDPTGGALWYHAEYVSPYWHSKFKQGPKIGQHIFYLAASKNN